MQRIPRVLGPAVVAIGMLLTAACSGHQQGAVVATPGGGASIAQPSQDGAAQPDTTSTIATNPKALTVRGTGSGFSGTFVATDTQQNFAGTIAATTSNASIATVSPSSITGQSGTFTVSPVALGTCTIRLNDGTTRKSLRVTVISAHGIYVTNRGAESVEVFAAAANGNAAPTATWVGKKTQFNTVNLLTVTGNGNVAATNIGPGVSGSLTIFSANPTGNAAPSAVVTGPDTGLNTPEGVFVDASGNTYVANADRIVEFGPSPNGDAVPMRTIAGPHTILSGPYQLTVDSTGKIYVAEGNVILVYAADASGDAAPVQEITGPATALLSTLGVAVDSTGKIYATNFNGNTINVYAAGATGNVQPTAVITSTALNEPYNIALDTAGNLYVTNFGGNSVVVLPAGSSGATTPTATISGAATGLNQPQGIFVF